jgi:hypothetical protein
MQSDSTTEAPVTAGIRRSAGRSVATDASA